MIREPRFVVTSVSGYSGEGGNQARWATVFQVLDSAYCFGIEGESFSLPRMEALAARLNRAHEREMELRSRPRVPIPEGSRLRHGTRSCYQNLRCRCFDCTTATRSHWAREKRQQAKR